jgi:hypothetical protein
VLVLAVVFDQHRVSRKKRPPAATMGRYLLREYTLLPGLSLAVPALLGILLQSDHVAELQAR